MLEILEDLEEEVEAVFENGFGNTARERAIFNEKLLKQEESTRKSYLSGENSNRVDRYEKLKALENLTVTYEGLNARPLATQYFEKAIDYAAFLNSSHEGFSYAYGRPLNETQEARLKKVFREEFSQMRQSVEKDVKEEELLRALGNSNGFTDTIRRPGNLSVNDDEIAERFVFTVSGASYQGSFLNRALTAKKEYLKKQLKNLVR